MKKENGWEDLLALAMVANLFSGDEVLRVQKRRRKLLIRKFRYSNYRKMRCKNYIRKPKKHQKHVKK